MKVALCLFGKVGAKTDKIDQVGKSSPEILELAFQDYKANLFDQYSTDIYVHSWSTDLQQEILDLYQPVAHIIEPQKHFPVLPGAEGARFYIGAMSRTYSMQQSVHLLQGDYDLVLTSRFDIHWKIPNLDNFQGDHLFIQNSCGYGENGKDQYRFGRNPSFLSSTHFHNDPKIGGFFDYWFGGSTEDIIKLANLYDQMPEYVKNKNLRNSRGDICITKIIYQYVIDTGLFDKVKLIHHYVDTPLVRRLTFNSQF